MRQAPPQDDQRRAGEGQEQPEHRRQEIHHLGKAGGQRPPRHQAQRDGALHPDRPARHAGHLVPRGQPAQRRFVAGHGIERAAANDHQRVDDRQRRDADEDHHRHLPGLPEGDGHQLRRWCRTCRQASAAQAGEIGPIGQQIERGDHAHAAHHCQRHVARAAHLGRQGGGIVEAAKGQHDEHHRLTESRSAKRLRHRRGRERRRAGRDQAGGSDTQHQQRQHIGADQHDLAIGRSLDPGKIEPGEHDNRQPRHPAARQPRKRHQFRQIIRRHKGEHRRRGGEDHRKTRPGEEEAHQRAISEFQEAIITARMREGVGQFGIDQRAAQREQPAQRPCGQHQHVILQIGRDQAGRAEDARPDHHADDNGGGGERP